MIKALYTTVLLGLCLVLGAQSKEDYVWLFGYDSNLNESGVESTIIDFSQESQFEGSRNLTDLWFIGNNASICDKDSNLLFYSNGCHVANGDHEIIENGSNLNYGDFIVQFRQDTCEHYPSFQDILILPNPSSDSTYVELFIKLQN